MGGPQIKILDIRPNIEVQYDLLPGETGRTRCLGALGQRVYFGFIYLDLFKVPSSCTKVWSDAICIINYIFHFSHKKK